MSVSAFAFTKGDRDSRRVALICLGATLLTRLLIKPAVLRYTGVETEVMTVDAFTLAGFTAVALSSSRFWPLWIAGLQLTTLLSHLSVVADVNLIPRVYAIAAVGWSYPILLILAIGTWRASRPAGGDPSADGRYSGEPAS